MSTTRKPQRAYTSESDHIIAQALAIMEARCRYEKLVLSSPKLVREYLRLRLHNLEHEVFLGIFLDAQNRVVAFEELARGTLTQTSVYPREVVKRALHHNAAAVIFAHNHPSGVAEPSRADELLTRSLKEGLSLIDIKVVDHMIVGGSDILSFAERGLI